MKNQQQIKNITVVMSENERQPHLRTIDGEAGETDDSDSSIGRTTTTIHHIYE